LIDRVKLLFWNWFLGKNLNSPSSFYEWVSTMLYVGTDKVCCGVMLDLDGSGRWKALMFFVIHVVNPCLSFSEGYSFSRGVASKGL
jgi:hypothetical protein